MTFETVKRNSQAIQRRVILADPESLRECADRLDQAAKMAHVGESVYCELTHGISILFKPEVGSKVYDYIEGGLVCPDPFTNVEPKETA